MAYFSLALRWATKVASPALLALARKSASAAIGVQLDARLRPAGLFLVLEGPSAPFLVVGEMHRLSQVVSAAGSSPGQALKIAGRKVDAGDGKATPAA